MVGCFFFSRQDFLFRSSPITGWGGCNLTYTAEGKTTRDVIITVCSGCELPYGTRPETRKKTGLSPVGERGVAPASTPRGPVREGNGMRCVVVTCHRAAGDLCRCRAGPRDGQGAAARSSSRDRDHPARVPPRTSTRGGGARGGARK